MPHQLVARQRLHEESQFALFMEQGTGKTWVLLAHAEHLFLHSDIQLLTVLTLSGIHRNWAEREIPKHLEAPHDVFLYTADILDKKHGEARFESWESGPDSKLRILCVNIEALQRGINRPICRLIQRLHRKWPGMMVVDESDTISGVSASRSRTAALLGKEAPFRYIATGTPDAESPFDYYAQFRFLNKQFLGFQNFATFKAHHAEFEQVQLYREDRTYPKLVRYRNLTELKASVDAHSYRCLKRDVLPDLPAKAFLIRPVELPEAHRKLYEQVRKQVIIELRTGRLTIRNALTRILRLVQITGGFVPQDDERAARPIYANPKDNPKLASLTSLVHDLPRDAKVIIWCRFRHECDLAYAALRGYAVKHTGDETEKERSVAIDAFQNGMHRYFIGTQASGGRGLTLTAASHVVYFSNDYSARNREQSEDRAHRIGQHNAVTYHDLLAVNTIDEKIHSVLADKKELSMMFSEQDSDGLARWLEAQ